MKKFLRFLITYFGNLFYIFRISLGKKCYFGHGLIINGKRKQTIKIQSNCSFGRFARLGNTSRGIFVGKNTTIGQFATILGNVTIGENNLIASYCTFLGGNHNMNPESQNGYMNLEDSNGADKGGINIGNNNWIGEKVVVVEGVTVGNYCIIGAGSVVTKNVPDYSMVAGNPARLIKKYDFDSHRWIACKGEK